MELPILAPTPVVMAHARVFRDLFDHQCQFRHFQHALTGLIVLPTKSLAHMARCSMESADKTQLSRLLAEAPWRAAEVNRRRIRGMRPPTTPHRQRRRESIVAIDATLCAHVGSLVAYVDRHDHHRDGTYPLAPNPVTSCAVRGPGRFPLGLRLDRRDEALPQWEAWVAQPVPDRTIPRHPTGRHRLHQQVDPGWLQEPEFRARHDEVRTTIALAVALSAAAMGHNVPCGVVVFDAWSVAEAWVRVLVRRRPDWSSVLNTNRLLETASLPWRETNGWALKWPGPPRAVAELVPLIPAHAYRPVASGEPTDWCFTLGVRIPGLGTVRIVVSVAQASLKGPCVVRVTNRVDWSAGQLLGLYLHRWPTDTFAQDSQGPWGFNASRMRSPEAIGKHWCLGFVAASLLPLTCLPAGPGRTQGLMHTMADACRQQGPALRQHLWMFVHDQRAHGATADQVFAQVFAKQRAMVPV